MHWNMCQLQKYLPPGIRVFIQVFGYSGIRVLGFSGIRVFRYSGIWVFRYLGKVESSHLNQLNLEEIKSARQDLELAAK